MTLPRDEIEYVASDYVDYDYVEADQYVNIDDGVSTTYTDIKKETEGG